jgi:hypothetical protein
MASSPPLEPKVVTPLQHRKRRHSALDRGSQVIDLTDDGDAVVQSSPVRPQKVIATGNGVKMHANGETNGQVARKEGDKQRQLEDEDEDDDDKSLFEDMLDTAELEPWQSGTLTHFRETDFVLTCEQTTQTMLSA